MPFLTPSKQCQSTEGSAVDTESVNVGDVDVQGEMVYSLLSILGTHNRDDMSHTLLAMSTSSDSCLAMKHSGPRRQLYSLAFSSDSDTMFTPYTLQPVD